MVLQFRSPRDRSPAKAGVQTGPIFEASPLRLRADWAPAFAGEHVTLPKKRQIRFPAYAGECANGEVGASS